MLLSPFLRPVLGVLVALSALLVLADLGRAAWREAREGAYAAPVAARASDADVAWPAVPPALPEGRPSADGDGLALVPPVHAFCSAERLVLAPGSMGMPLGMYLCRLVDSRVFPDGRGGVIRTVYVVPEASGHVVLFPYSGGPDVAGRI